MSWHDILRTMTRITARKSPQVNAGMLAAMAEFRYELRRFLHFSETSAETQGISAQKYQLLQVVEAASATGRVTISTIAERMVLRHNSAVELVDRAERLGLVERLSDETDLRRSIVVLTEHGKRVLMQVAAAHLVELERAGPAMMEALARLGVGRADVRVEGAWR